MADIPPDPSITGTVDVEARGAIQETNEDTINQRTMSDPQNKQRPSYDQQYFGRALEGTSQPYQFMTVETPELAKYQLDPKPQDANGEPVEVPFNEVEVEPFDDETTVMEATKTNPLVLEATNVVPGSEIASPRSNIDAVS